MRLQVLQIRDLEALKPPRFWKMCCLKRLQVGYANLHAR